MEVALGVALGMGADDMGAGIAADMGTDIGTDIGTGIGTGIADDTGTDIGTVRGGLSRTGSDGKWPLEAALPGAGPDLRPDSLYGSIARRFLYSRPHLPEPLRTRP